MAFDLFAAVNRVWTPGTISRVAGLIGETPANTEKAAQATVASLAGLACNRAATPTGSDHILSLISPGKLDHGISTGFGSLLDMENGVSKISETGTGLVRGLLGTNTSAVAGTIAAASGVKASSASYLMNLLAPLVYGTLGKEAYAQGLTGAGLSSLLASHRDVIQRYAPAGLANALGVNSMSNLCGTPVPMERPVPVPIPERHGNSRWLWALPLVLLAVAIPTYRSCSSPTMASVTLPCGTVLMVHPGSFTQNLATFLLKGSDSELPKQIVFDHLNFDTASAQLNEDSTPTVRDLTAIMKCYPNLQIQLEGYTDSVGDPATNKTLSLNRATTVKNMLVAGGIDDSRISVDGWGEEKPIASNDTEEGRSRNRRTELVVQKIK
jgi:outer membrane protein OmpA-like peptidoglycan-associated protein